MLSKRILEFPMIELENWCTTRSNYWISRVFFYDFWTRFLCPFPFRSNRITIFSVYEKKKTLKNHSIHSWCAPYWTALGFTELIECSVIAKSLIKFVSLAIRQCVYLEASRLLERCPYHPHSTPKKSME